MPYEIVRLGDGKGYIKNTKTGRHFSKSPIPLANAERQMRLLESEKAKYYRPMGEPGHIPGNPGKDEKWIQEVVESPKFKKGAFTAQAKEHGKTPMEFMKEVLANPNKYDATTRRRAQFLKNIQ